MKSTSFSGYWVARHAVMHYCTVDLLLGKFIGVSVLTCRSCPNNTTGTIQWESLIGESFILNSCCSSPYVYVLPCSQTFMQ